MSNSVCLSEGATVTKGAGLTESSIAPKQIPHYHNQTEAKQQFQQDMSWLISKHRSISIQKTKSRFNFLLEISYVDSKSQGAIQARFRDIYMKILPQFMPHLKLHIT